MWRRLGIWSCKVCHDYIQPIFIQIYRHSFVELRTKVQTSTLLNITRFILQTETLLRRPTLPNKTNVWHITVYNAKPRNKQTKREYKDKLLTQVTNTSVGTTRIRCGWECHGHEQETELNREHVDIVDNNQKKIEEPSIFMYVEQLGANLSFFFKIGLF